MQCSTRKQECDDIQIKARKKKVLSQLPIDFDVARAIGSRITDTACEIMMMRHQIPIKERILYLITTVMLATGARLTEVVLLSAFEPSDTTECDKINIIDGAHIVRINPVAKGRDSSQKSSSRVILLGLNAIEIDHMVKRLREYLKQAYPHFADLNANKRDDRERAMRTVITPLSNFVAQQFQPLISERKMTPRDLRSLYVSISYKLWAKHPTSEVMWINQMLDHTNMDTSIAYNSFHLSHFCKSDTERKLRKEITRLRKLIEALHTNAKNTDIDENSR